jgi:hypothetical protein
VRDADTLIIVGFLGTLIVAGYVPRRFSGTELAVPAIGTAPQVTILAFTWTLSRTVRISGATCYKGIWEAIFPVRICKKLDLSARALANHINSCQSTLLCTKHIVPVTPSHRTPHQRARFTDSPHRLDELLEARLPSLLTLAIIKACLMLAEPEAGSECTTTRMHNANSEYVREAIRRFLRV